jgi:hypothetical protein
MCLLVRVRREKSGMSGSARREERTCLFQVQEKFEGRDERGQVEVRTRKSRQRDGRPSGEIKGNGDPNDWSILAPTPTLTVFLHLIKSIV